jgi:hypothetical protein
VFHRDYPRPRNCPAASRRGASFCLNSTVPSGQDGVPPGIKAGYVVGYVPTGENSPSLSQFQFFTRLAASAADPPAAVSESLRGSLRAIKSAVQAHCGEWKILLRRSSRCSSQRGVTRSEQMQHFKLFYRIINPLGGSGSCSTPDRASLQSFR